MIPIKLNSPELGRRRPRRLQRRWSPQAEQLHTPPFRGEEPSAAGLPRATPHAPARGRRPLRRRLGPRALVGPFTPLPRAEHGNFTPQPASEPVVHPPPPTPEESYLSQTYEQMEGAQPDEDTIQASSEQYGLTQLSESLALQVAAGQRGLILPLAENIFIVSAVPSDALKPELGLAPAVAEVLVSTATHALSQPQTQEALVDLAQKAGKGIVQLTQQVSKGFKKGEKTDAKKSFTPQPRHEVRRAPQRPERLSVSVPPSSMRPPGELLPVVPSTWSPPVYPPGMWPGYYVGTPYPVPVPTPTHPRLRGETSHESSLEVIIGVLESHLNTLEQSSSTCACQQRR